MFTDPKRIFKSPGFPNEYDDNQICYWHIRLKYGQRIHLSFLDFDLEDDPACLADYVEVYAHTGAAAREQPRDSPVIER